MQIGQPDTFSQNDSEAQRVSKLNNTLGNLWRSIVEQKQNPQQITAPCYGHTTKMPETGASNRDHDKRYYPKTQINPFLIDRTGWPEDPGVTLSYDGANRIFTVTDGGSAYYWIKGIRYTLNGNHTVTLTDEEGLWYIYFDGATLTASTTAWIITSNNKALVAYVYLDVTNNKSIYTGYELHDYMMPASVHDRLHDAGGTAWSNGLAVTDNGDETVNISEGDIFDEDIEITITDGNGGSLWEQILTPAEMPIYYRDL